MLAGAETKAEGRATMTQENMLARYSVLHELGRGATAAVYAARDRETGAVVALKRLDPAFLARSEAGFAARFLKGARSARLLRHGNIVRVHGAGEGGGTVYVAMEMLEGQSLRALLDAGPIPVARAIQIARDIARGLAHAHLEGVVHGAIKPSAVIVLRSGAVKISDFGVGPVGCLGYLSPEQLRGGPLDHRCDVFSLGAVFYEMLARRRPFAGASPKEMVENILRAKPPLPSALNEHVPRALDAIVLRMLAAEPAGRMPGAPILIRDLQRLEEGLGLGSGASASPRADPDEPKASVPPPEKPKPTTRPPEKPKPATRPPDPNRRPGAAPKAAFDYQKAMAIMERESRPARSSGGSRSRVFQAAVVLAALGIGFAGFKYYDWSGMEERDIVVRRVQEAPSRSPAVTPPTAPPPVAEAATEPAIAAAAPETPSPPQPAAADPEPLAQAERFVAPAAEPPPSADAATTPEPTPAMQPVANVHAEQPRGTAQVIMTVSPQGEIYINGKHHGTTPPIGTLYLEPGMHRIEVRSGSRKPYLTYMTVQAGDVRRIRHDFDLSRVGRPPKSASLQNSRLAR